MDLAFDELDVDELDDMDDFEEDGLDELDELDELDDMDEVDEWDDFDGLDEVDELDEWDDLDELDDDPFIGSIANWWRKQPASRRKVATQAARVALSGAGGLLGGSIGTRYGGKWGGVLGGTLGHGLGRVLGAYLPNNDKAAMDYLAEMAVQADDDADAEAFIGALIPMAARLLPSAARVASRVAPRLISGLSRVTRTLRQNPQTRQLIRALPNVARNVTRDVARHATRRGLPSPQVVGRYLANRTRQALSHPSAARPKPRVIAQVRRQGPIRRPGMGAMPPRGRASMHPARGRGRWRSRMIRTPRGYCNCYNRI